MQPVFLGKNYMGFVLCVDLWRAVTRAAAGVLVSWCACLNLGRLQDNRHGIRAAGGSREATREAGDPGKSFARCHRDQTSYAMICPAAKMRHMVFSVRKPLHGFSVTGKIDDREFIINF